jgi:hypothetical protein
MQVSGLNRDKVTALGFLVLKKHPEISRDLLALLEAPEPLETDFNKMSLYFEAFSRMTSIPVSELRLSDRNRSRSYQVKVFVATMLRIYQPYVPTHRGYILKSGFSTALSQVINKYTSNISNLFQEIQVLEKAYDEFRSEVDYSEYYLTQAVNKL